MIWLRLLWDFLVTAFSHNMPVNPPDLPSEPSLPPKPTPAPIDPPHIVMARQAAVWIGRDPSTPDLANDELGCADSVSAIVRTVYPQFVHTVSTITLFNNLKADKKHFKAVLTPMKGCIIVSPRMGKQPGHTGIFLTDRHIASNNSKRGLWEGNYSYESWITYFKHKKGLRIYLFQPI